MTTPSPRLPDDFLTVRPGFGFVCFQVCAVFCPAGVVDEAGEPFQPNLPLTDMGVPVFVFAQAVNAIVEVETFDPL